MKTIRVDFIIRRANVRSKRCYIKVLRRNSGAGYIGRTIYGHVQGDRRTSDEELDGYGCRMVSVNI